ncbi:integrase [Stenotrophomonas maltophilia group sp. CASM26]|uniref:integrase n=1 Tax=Stenotrophomonas maltophilia group sp. CASM26 TaxID=3111514 RepID=UPI003BF88C36
MPAARKVETAQAATLHPSFQVDYDSDVWTFAQTTVGQQKEFVTVDWAIPVARGELLTDYKHRGLLSELKCYLKTAIIEDTVRMTVGSIPGTYMGMRELVKFMGEREIHSLFDITTAMSWDYVEGLEEQYMTARSDAGRDRAWTHATAYKLIHPLTQIYEIADSLRARGGQAPCEAPFDGRKTYDVVTEPLGLARTGGLMPVPDEISVPILSYACEWIEYGSEDVIRLQAEVIPMLIDARSATGPRRIACFRQIKRHIEEFQMSPIPGTLTPWHEPLATIDRIDDAGDEREISGTQGLRRLILMTQSACSVLLQGCTGIRAHELIGLSLDHDPTLQHGVVKSVTSLDGLMEVFSICGISAKREATRHEWTAGLRPLGTNHLPIVLKSVEVLVRLMEPWRALSGTKSLMLSFSHAKSLPSGPDGIGRMTASRNSLLQREFAVEALTKKRGIETTQAVYEVRYLRPQRWRITFAHYVFRSKPELMPALRTLFRHMSEQITDQGYIGNDAALLENLEGERVMETSRFLVQITLGRPIGGGPAQRLLMQHAESMTEALSKMDGETPIDKAVAYVKLTDLRIWTGTYASCLIDMLPDRSSCNPQASLLTVRASPNFGLRSPGLCAGCKCCIILPEHKDFWEDRLLKNQAIVQMERTNSRDQYSKIAMSRVVQSRAVLRMISNATGDASDRSGES